MPFRTLIFLPWNRLGARNSLFSQEYKSVISKTPTDAKQLAGYQRNPLIADAFHRTGDVEIWGRGTNRVIDACRKHGIAPPQFEEKQGWLGRTQP